MLERLGIQCLIMKTGWGKWGIPDQFRLDFRLTLYGFCCDEIRIRLIGIFLGMDYAARRKRAKADKEAKQEWEFKIMLAEAVRTPSEGNVYKHLLLPQGLQQAFLRELMFGPGRAIARTPSNICNAHPLCGGL